MTAQFQINNICDSNVHDAEEPLIAFLELALVKNLNGDNGRLLDVTGAEGEVMKMDVFEGGRRGLHIEALVPIGIQSLPNDASRVGLLRIDRNDCEWVRETKDLALG